MRDKLGRFVKGHPYGKRFKKGIVPWNKGTEGIIKATSGSFKKGFKPWNKGKALPQFQKENCHLWKGGRTINRGYVYLYRKNHPFADKRGYVLESHLVMEKHLGRYLLPEEVVHHIDGNKLNNHINNLVLFPTKSAHTKFHRLENPNGKSC